MLLRPLAEGLATLAEHDLSPGLRSPVLPPPLRWAVFFFARRELYANDSRSWVRRRLDAFELVTAELGEVRSSAASRQRKEALLAEPLSCQQSDGYLAGYLGVKNIWHQLTAIHERYGRADTCLLFLHKLFYQDTELRKRLLDPSQSLPESLPPVVVRIHELLSSAFGPGIAEELDHFWQGLTTLRAAARESGDMLAVAVEDADPTLSFVSDWRQVFGHDIEDLGNPGGWTAANRAEVGYHGVTYSRDLLNLGSIDATLEVDGDATRIIAGGREVATLATVNARDTGTSDGVAGVLLGTRSGHHIAYAFAGTTLVALSVTPLPDDETRIEFVRGVMGRKMVGAVNYEIAAAETEINGLDELRRVPGYLQQTRDKLDAVYVPFALASVPESRQMDAAEKMMTEGFFGLFDGDADLVRGLAVLLTQADSAIAPDAFKAELSELGLEYDSLVARLRDSETPRKRITSTPSATLADSFTVRCEELASSNGACDELDRRQWLITSAAADEGRASRRGRNPAIGGQAECGTRVAHDRQRPAEARRRGRGGELAGGVECCQRCHAAWR